jgi:hypothetical protein
MTLRAAKKRLRNDSATGIKDLRDVSVLVMHPDDEDGRNLIEQLQRIGCQVRVQWPIPERLSAEADVIVLAGCRRKACRPTRHGCCTPARRRSFR